jgi:hypothetical protein
MGYIVDELKGHRDFFGIPKEGEGKLRMLDYACGPGTISSVRLTIFSCLIHTLLRPNSLGHHPSRPSPDPTNIHHRHSAPMSPRPSAWTYQPT